MGEHHADSASRGQYVFPARLAVGLLQGLALYLLYSAYDARTWPATDGALFAPMAIIALFVPLLVVQAVGNVRLLTLILWTLLAAAIAGGLAWYDIWHGWPTETSWESGKLAHLPRILPEFATFFFTAAFLFIAQALIAAGDADRKIVANYHTHFDVAWKQGLQFVLAWVFVAIFWALLWLGAFLFNLINLDFLEKLIEHRWFAIPATTLASAGALHITDVRAVLVRGARSLVLALFSWLLPLIVLIAAGFLFSLFFTGLTPLWNTRRGTSMLLVAAAWIIVLINAAYQDGDAERKPVIVLRWAGTLGGLLLLPIVALSGYALWLRIAQYGWTADRISAAACVIVAAAFAAGYAIAALWPREWFKPVERWNFATAILVLAVIGALFSPVADPMRISVASQISLLQTGKVSPDKFDYWYLRWHGGRYGKAELEKLLKSKDIRIANGAKSALTNVNPWERIMPPPPAPSAEELAKLITMHPAGAKLPDDLVKQGWQAADYNIQQCFSRERRKGWSCDAVMKDLDGDGIDEILLIRSGSERFDWWYLTAFKRMDGKWQVVGSFSKSNAEVCKGEREAVLAGNFKPLVPLQRDLEVGGRRLVMMTSRSDDPCK
jgi:hypothetical protein